MQPSKKLWIFCILVFGTLATATLFQNCSGYNKRAPAQAQEQTQNNQSVISVLLPTFR